MHHYLNIKVIYCLRRALGELVFYIKKHKILYKYIYLSFHKEVGNRLISRIHILNLKQILVKQ